MNSPTEALSISRVLKARMTQLFNQWLDVQFIHLCTADGFHLFEVSGDADHLEPDKVAAIASSIFALSNTAARQFLDDELQVSIVETDAGNILFLRTRMNGADRVLTIAARKSMSLATVRYHALTLSELIEKHSDAN